MTTFFDWLGVIIISSIIYFGLQMRRLSHLAMRSLCTLPMVHGMLRNSTRVIDLVQGLHLRVDSERLKHESVRPRNSRRSDGFVRRV